MVCCCTPNFHYLKKNDHFLTANTIQFKSAQIAVFKKHFFIVVQLQLSPFSPDHRPAPHAHYPPLNRCPLALSTCPLYTLLDGPSLIFSHYSSPLSLLVTVSLFYILTFLVIFCSLVCFIDKAPFIGEIIWYLSFTAWLISLSIMLSSSIHAIVKGRSSFFLSAV